MSIFRNLKRKLLHYSWDLAIYEPSSEEIEFDVPFSRYHVVKNPYKSKWFADPFILSCKNGVAKVLVEEFDKAVNRGRIALLDIEVANNIIANCKIVLDLDTHLSFPAIYRVGDKIYIHPENADSGHSDFYIYNESDESILYASRFMDSPLTDAVLREIDDKFYLFTTSLPDPNGKILSIFVSDNLSSGYKRYQDKEFDDCTARMAGAIFRRGNELIRPAQDCNGTYGRQVIFQKIARTEQGFLFETISKLYPTGLKYDGIHTFNYHDSLQIIDLKKYDYPLIYKLKNIIKGRR